MAKIKDIRYWYSFKPEIDVWFSKTKGRSAVSPTYDETWYGGDYFVAGYFMFIQFGAFAVHVLIQWWKIKL